jgi:hydrogenase expression/formation protein HypC
MCIGVPLRVVESDGAMARCEGNGRSERVNLMLTGEQPPGTWVLVFQGSAIRVLSEDEARATSDALGALDAALHGGDVDAFFADLVDREPILPEHLRKDTQ